MASRTLPSSTSSFALHRLELLTRVPWYWRPDVVPVIALYGVAVHFAIALAGSPDAGYARFAAAPPLLAGLAHALLLLCQQWFVAFWRRVAFARAPSAEAATHVFIPGDEAMARSNAGEGAEGGAGSSGGNGGGGGSTDSSSSSSAAGGGGGGVPIRSSIAALRRAANADDFDGSAGAAASAGLYTSGVVSSAGAGAASAHARSLLAQPRCVFEHHSLTFELHEGDDGNGDGGGDGGGGGGLWASSAPLPDNFPLADYCAHRGWARAEHVTLAQQRFGVNRLEVPVPSFLELFREHAVAPLFVFQIFSVCLWLLDDHPWSALYTLGMLVFAEAMQVYARIQTAVQLRGMRPPPQRVFAYRVGRWVDVNGADLVPLDIVSLVRKAPPPASAQAPQPQPPAAAGTPQAAAAAAAAAA